jgi:calcineurin-like phosphoesterase family protein
MYTKQNTSQDDIQTIRRTLNTRKVIVQGQHASKDQVYRLRIQFEE